MPYVDGFVIAVAKKNLPAYRRISKQAGKLWREHGAKEYIEAAGDDLNTNMGVSFAKLMKLKPGETVMFSWILYKSRKERDSVNARVMKDPRMQKMMAKGPMPFDVKRMVYGGFKSIVEL